MVLLTVHERILKFNRISIGQNNVIHVGQHEMSKDHDGYVDPGDWEVTILDIVIERNRVFLFRLFVDCFLISKFRIKEQWSNHYEMVTILTKRHTFLTEMIWEDMESIARVRFEKVWIDYEIERNRQKSNRVYANFRSLRNGCQSYGYWAEAQ